jgi:hypothetical protein
MARNRTGVEEASREPLFRGLVSPLSCRGFVPTIGALNRVFSSPWRSLIRGLERMQSDAAAMGGALHEIAKLAARF